MQKFAKFIVAAIGVILSYMYAYNVTTPTHWVSVVLAVATALGVYAIPNSPAV